ncbi:Crp/Fnr family transcriptional regulator [Flavobacterium pectinovorum]|uniref:Crp/Fnr family transcriptional regulator n=1 Tax=Flavobacterium pectinovorum TaxID=29533 RepID=A0A502F7K8_9FLAO|nr:Crp/Fnr family transcriptional regulator [Flavobacterium pectinovorum]TPG45349.1 Crp/Fnr family transcriptional regulator [Flavobacterium pectinovorum]
MSKKAIALYFKTTNLITAEMAEEIASHFESKIILKNQMHLTEGTICDEYLFLEKGFMRAFAFDIEGNEVTTNFYSPGDVVFEVASFFNRTKSKENINAVTDSVGWYITYEQLNNLFHSLPEFREFGRSILVKGFSELKTRMLSMISETAEERYIHLLKSNPEIFQQASLKTIASFLGITDTSLSRIRKEISKK